MPTPANMMQQMIDKGITQENVAAFKELVVLSEHMEDRNSERQFTASFVALQKHIPTIVARTVIPNRGKYERFEDIMEVIRPILEAHGFSVSFTMDFKDNRILETCHLSHVGGFTRSNSFAVRTRKADSDTQADCMAATTAKRNALCNALNIVIRQDCLNNEDDAGIEGDVDTKITDDQAFELERRCHETESNIEAFLRFAKAKTFKDIMASRYDELDALLARKEENGR
jgi:hypothetical protein